MESERITKPHIGAKLADIRAAAQSIKTEIVQNEGFRKRARSQKLCWFHLTDDGDRVSERMFRVAARDKSAEYQDYTSAMSFEDNNQKLGNYYANKGGQVHHLIDRMEEGQPVKDAEIAQALDNSAAEKYDDRPPVPLDDESGNGY
jgi:hypothetical protein